jgi:hypothetical protein
MPVASAGMRFKIIAFVLVALLVVSFSVAITPMFDVPLPAPKAFAEQAERRDRPPRQQDLQPSEGFFSWVGPPDAYHLAVRKALIGEHPYRSCELVVLPSFHAEWVVYIVRADLVRPEQSPATIVFKRFKVPLWNEMMTAICDPRSVKLCTVTPAAEEAALARIVSKLDRAAASLTTETFALLESVWWTMLGRARYPTQEMMGLDGTQYFAAHWKAQEGFRSGETWSPDESSLSGGLVALAEQMATYAQSPSRQGELDLASKARAMLGRLNNEP